MAEDEWVYEEDPTQDLTLPEVGSWAEMSGRMAVQGKAMDGMRRQMQKMGEEMARQKEKIDMLSRLARTPSGTRKD